MSYAIETQEFLRENGLEALCLTFAVKANRHGKYPNLVLLKYNQIESDFSQTIVKQCRGIILDEANNWNVICRSMDKFFNLGQGEAAAVNFETATIQTKEDGCCHEDTLVESENGQVTIKELCETNYKGRVKSYDVESSEVVFEAVEAVSIADNLNNWYLIELEDGTKLRLTGNHRIWLPQLKCYRRVDELDGTEEVLLSPN